MEQRLRRHRGASRDLRPTSEELLLLSISWVKENRACSQDFVADVAAVFDIIKRRFTRDVGLQPNPLRGRCGSSIAPRPTGGAHPSQGHRRRLA